MTALRHVRLRDGVFQYERRVPARVQRDALRFAELFASRPLFRRSLRTKDQGEAFAAASIVHADFERRVADPVRKPILLRQRGPKTGARVVTDLDLEQVRDRYRHITSQGYEKALMLANVNQQAADELERIEYELGLDADTIRQTLKARSPSEIDLIVHPADETRAIIADLGFNAPEGSREMGALIAAVRMGMEQGYARIGALASGKAMPTLDSGASPALGERSLTLADAVERYLGARKLPAKAESETKLALRQFEEAVGRKALIATTRADFHEFAAYLANTKVGRKTAGSVERNLSIHSIGKRVRMLSAAIGHGRSIGSLHATQSSWQFQYQVRNTWVEIFEVTPRSLARG